MKAQTLRLLIILPLLLAGIIFTWHHLMKKRTATEETRSNHVRVGANPQTQLARGIGQAEEEIPPLMKRLGMSRRDHLALLERIGHLPLDRTDHREMKIAEKTSWWGKRLDPATFWSNRVVWLDRSAIGEAQTYGRDWPPIPFDDPRFEKCDDSDYPPPKGYDINDINVHTKHSYREDAFWNWFVFNHPRPPERIDKYNSEVAMSWLRRKNTLETDPEEAKRFRVTSESIAGDIVGRRSRAAEDNYPPEFHNEEAYFWNGVLALRTEYQEALQKYRDEEQMDLFFWKKVPVDRKYILDPLTEENMRAANAWKVAYLNRLRSEQWDESYINAYLQAWNLSEEYVFGTSPK